MGFKRLEDGVISGTTLVRPFLGASLVSGKRPNGYTLLTFKLNGMS